MVRNQRDNPQTEMTVTNFTERVAFDCNTATLAETNDALGTVIRELIEAGIIQGTVSA